MDLAAVQSGSEFQRMFTAFFTFFSAHWSMQVEAWQRFGQGKPSVASSAKLAKDMLWLTVIPAILSSWILDGGPDEDDDEGWGEWAMKLVAAYGVGGLPLVRDAMQGLTSDFGFSGPPAMRAFEMAIEAATAADDGKVTRFEAKSVAMFLSYMLKLPGRQAVRTADYLFQYAEGETRGEFDPWQAAVTGFRRQ